MEIFEDPHYRINKFLLTCLGQWPYQNPLHKRAIRLSVLVLAVSIVIPEVLQLIDVWGIDLDSLVDCGSILGVQMSVGMKFSNYIFNADRMRIITDRIYNDWKLAGNGPQSEIMKAYADTGRKLTEFYSGLKNCLSRTYLYMYATLVSYVAMPIMPKLLDLVIPLNESRAITFPLPTKYGDIDPDKYYFPMMVHADCAVVVTITTIVAMDSTYAVYVQHACGLFAALGHKLEHLMDIDPDGEMEQIDSKRKEEMIYQEIVSCVKMHSDAIEFCDVIESGHLVSFFIVVGFIVICMSLAGYQMVMNLDKPNEAFRFATFTIAHVAHIFFISWPGQKLIDHSERIHEWAYGAQWYDVSNRSKKLLLLMMLRSEVPCKLTAGKLYVMSFANFSLVVRTSVSYFTVLTSFR